MGTGIGTGCRDGARGLPSWAAVAGRGQRFAVLGDRMPEAVSEPAQCDGSYAGLCNYAAAHHPELSVDDVHTRADIHHICPAIALRRYITIPVEYIDCKGRLIIYII